MPIGTGDDLRERPCSTQRCLLTRLLVKPPCIEVVLYCTTSTVVFSRTYDLRIGLRTQALGSVCFLQIHWATSNLVIAAHTSCPSSPNGRYAVARSNSRDSSSWSSVSIVVASSTGSWQIQSSRYHSDSGSPAHATLSDSGCRISPMSAQVPPRRDPFRS